MLSFLKYVAHVIRAPMKSKKVIPYTRTTVLLTLAITNTEASQLAVWQFLFRLYIVFNLLSNRFVTIYCVGENNFNTSSGTALLSVNTTINCVEPLIWILLTLSEAPSDLWLLSVAVRSLKGLKFHNFCSNKHYSGLFCSLVLYFGSFWFTIKHKTFRITIMDIDTL